MGCGQQGDISTMSPDCPTMQGVYNEGVKKETKGILDTKRLFNVILNY